MIPASIHAHLEACEGVYVGPALFHLHAPEEDVEVGLPFFVWCFLLASYLDTLVDVPEMAEVWDYIRPMYRADKQRGAYMLQAELMNFLEWELGFSANFLVDLHPGHIDLLKRRVGK